MNAAVPLSIPQLEREIARVFALQQQRKLELRSSTAQERIAKLKALRAAVTEAKARIVEAAYADMRKPEVEAILGEMLPVLSTIDYTAKRLRRWMRPRRVPAPLNLLGTRSYIQYEPKGAALIISPWNVPIFLSFVPLASAVAAGCTAIIKPSEMTPNLARVVREIASAAFDEDEVAVFEGGPEVAQALLRLPFDHIFYTGNPEIGKVVMRAAAEHLTSVTLELGGKSPVFVDESADVDQVAERLAWGKFMNSGQICVAPDYVLVHESREQELLGALKREIEQRFGDGARAPAEFTRIVNERHVGRVKALLDDALARGAKLVTGGKADPADRFVAPTVLTDVPPDARIMQEEIFGPLLPVLSYRDLGEALELVNAKPKPLALYVFSKLKANVERVLKATSAGGSTVNHVMLHGLHPHMPFGGVNHSGIGKSGGYWGFQAFSNERAVTRQVTGYTPTRFAKPPYPKLMKRMLARMAS